MNTATHTARNKEDITTIRVTKEVAKIVNYLAMATSSKDACGWLEDLLVDHCEAPEIARLAPKLNERRKALARKPRKLSM